MSLENLDSAIRMKQIIKRQANREIAVNVPTSVAGRVIDVDITHLKASVWFPGDPEPLEVFLFSHLVPAAWERKEANASSDGSTSVTGYGSFVLCERFNGKLYVTQVMTGGQLEHDSNVLNQQMVQNIAVETLSDKHIVGEIYETSINCKISDDALTDEQAIKFGPFVRADLTEPGSGFFECTVCVDGVGMKSYRFTMDIEFGWTEFDNVRKWYRILPEHEISATSTGTVDIVDFDLDISRDYIQYREAEEKSGFLPIAEVWFRIFKRGGGTGLDADFTIRTGAIQFGRRNEGMLQQIIQVSPMPAVGYVGVHNANAGFDDHTFFEVHDTFDRVTTAGWGNSDDFMQWSPEANSSAFSTDMIAGLVTAASTATNYIAHGSSSGIDSTVLAEFSLPATTTGSYVEVGAVIRRVDTSNHWSMRLRFNTAGTLTLALVKRVAGTETTVTTAVSGLSYSANTRIWLRFYVTGDDFYGRVWLNGTDEPTTWLITQTDTALTGQLGNHGIIVRRNTGNTNSNIVTSFNYFEQNNFWPTIFLPQASDEKLWQTGAYRSADLRLANDIQKTAVFDGDVIWTGSRIRWTGALVIGGVGRHRNGLKTGKSYCTWSNPTQPLKFPSGDFADCDATGTELLPGESLWIGLEPGKENNDLRDFMMIVEDVAPGFQVPEWWVLVAHRPHRGNFIKLGDGRVIDSGREVDSSTSSTSAGAIGIGDTLIHTITNFNWRANSAYRVELRVAANLATAGATLINYHLRKTNTAGTLLIDWGWHEIQATPPIRGHFMWGFVRRNAATDLQATVVGTALVIAGTGTVFANTTLRRALSIEYAGPIDKYPDAFDIT